MRVADASGRGPGTGRRPTAPQGLRAWRTWFNSAATNRHFRGRGAGPPLRQDAAFTLRYLADEDPAGRVRVRTRDAGATAYLHVQSSLQAAFGADGSSGSGADADYRVTDALAELIEVLGGRRIPAVVATLFAGHFVEPALLHLTPEARVVRSRRGSIFRSF